VIEAPAFAELGCRIHVADGFLEGLNALALCLSACGCRLILLFYNPFDRGMQFKSLRNGKATA
jgi:hypothetical protein